MHPPGMSRAAPLCLPGWVSLYLTVMLMLIAGCAQQGGPRYISASQQPAFAPSRYYPPPGPPDDPWGPYIAEAAARFQIPQQWIRAVMAQESGGEEQAVSPVGAMGLMQIMPETYQDLQAQYGLGDDPFDPHDNILAGAAYIREMYDRYGAPGFLAGYNAGPEDVDAYLAGNASLPDETVNYLAMVTPNLGTDIPFSGPFAGYAATGALSQPAPSLADFAAGCDLNAAYDPDHPCSALAQGRVIAGQPALVASAIVADASAGSCDADAAYDPDDPCTAAAGGGGAGSCDTDRAYDPDSPCTTAQPALASAAPVTEAPVTEAPVAEAPPAAQAATAPDCGPGTGFNPACPASVLASVQAATPAPAAAPGGDWAIQVGAFTNANLAQSMAQNARNELSNLLGNAAIVLPPTTPFGGNILYQARLTHLSAQTALQACSALNQRQLPCVVVQPSST